MDRHQRSGTGFFLTDKYVIILPENANGNHLKGISGGGPMKDIKELVEKTLNFGLGLAAYSREKIEELVEEMVRKGDVAQKDARQLAADLVHKGEEQKVELQKLVHDEVTRILDKMDLVRKSDIQEHVTAALRDAGMPDAGSGNKPGQPQS
jgi:polyhydroxyalkanoate synthesis regulator phasin